jgi:hypothetical protein
MNNLPRTLDEILKDYKQTEKFSKQSSESFPLPGRPGIEVRIAQAKVKLPKLRLEYLTRILRSSFGFFLEGDETKGAAFAKIALDNGAVLVDADEIFIKLADAIQYSIGPNKEFSITQTGLMDHALRELVEKTGYDGTLNRTQITDMRVVNTREKLVNYIRELVARNNGSTPVTVCAQSDIVAQALAKEFNGKRLVVVVKNASSNTRAPLAGLFTKSTNVDLDSIEDVNEETAATIFRDGLGIKASA